MIEVICGSMFSGKTEELIRRLTRAKYARQKIQVFKPAIDNRYSSDHIQSHDANKIPSLIVSNAIDILGRVDDTTRVVGIDEVQFFDDLIIEVVQRLANRGLRVIVAGLDMDFRGEPFGPMPILLSIAESITKLSAICVVCGKQASRTQRINHSNDVVLIGAKDSYEARCRTCHEFKSAIKQKDGLNSNQLELAAETFSKRFDTSNSRAYAAHMGFVFGARWAIKNHSKKE